MHRIVKKVLIIILAISLLPIAIGCMGGLKRDSFKELSKLDNATLVKEARARKDKAFYGKATADVVFQIYFPLVLPDGIELVKHFIKSSDFDGNVGQLAVFYQRGNDELIIYQGRAPYDQSPDVIKRDIALGPDKPNASYYRKDNGYTYISWQEDNPDDYPLYNNDIDYLVKAKGLSDDELIGTVKKMVIYNDQAINEAKN